MSLKELQKITEELEKLKQELQSTHKTNERIEIWEKFKKLILIKDVGTAS